MLLLELGLLEMEILFLGLDNHCELRFLGFCLFDQSFELRDFFEIFYFLVCNFLVELILLLL